MSWTPLTERPSSTWTCRSASFAWRAEVTAYRIRATWRVRITAGGSTTRVISASCQLRATMATTVPTTTVRLEAIEVAVEVTTDCMLPMSLTTRDCTSPPRVRVKKPTDWRCRWPKRSERSRCMTRWPTVVDCQVWIDADRGRHEGDADHGGHEDRQQRDVLLGDGLVDDALDEERLGQPDERADDDQGETNARRGAVRREEAADPAQRDGRVRELAPVGALAVGVAAGAAVHGAHPFDHLLSHDRIW